MKYELIELILAIIALVILFTELIYCLRIVIRLRKERLNLKAEITELQIKKDVINTAIEEKTEQQK